MGSEDERKASSLSRWMTLFKERAPILLFAFIALGPICSSQYLVNGKIDVVRLIAGTFGFMAVLLLVRVMDDVKDYDTDVEVHPDRPLPRGLLTVDEVVHAIKIATVSLFGLALVYGILYGFTAGAVFASLMVYVVLMYFEFGIGTWLDERPLLYGLSHQFAIVIAAAFACALAGDEDALWKRSTYCLGAVGLSGFFAYEVCRKLDPTLPKKKGTYLVIYGRWKVFAIVTGTVALGVLGGNLLSLQRLLFPLQATLLVSLFTLFAAFPESKKFKLVEGLAIVYFLVHVWSGALFHWFMA
ncbi:uncharacterized protein LOC135814138 isoform X2 [Sycon ciliatum]|uniref:uncharacterized protein LOC135814138 isoform X2 n=1 Tax=Sycon ciliatum TaxID=27933 RepID=UPI0020AA90D0|eukprot:scpid57055/ scgid23895/ 